MGYEKLYESNSLAAISRALRSTQAGAAPSSRPAATAEHVKQDEAALPNMKKRKQLVAQSLSTELPSKQSVAALLTRKKRRKSDEQGADTDTVADEAEKTPKSLKRKKMAKLTVESLQDGSEPQAEGPAEQARKRLGGDVPGASPSTAPAQAEEPPTFRDVYVSAFTDGFAADLEALRKAEGAALRLDLLQRCIEVGMDVFTDVELRLCTRDAVRRTQPHEAAPRPSGSVVHAWL